MFVKKLKNVRLFNRTLKLLVLSFCFTFCTSVYANSSNAMPAIITYLLSSSNPPRDSNVPKTGQTISYTAFDDGHYQKGVSRSYSRANDVVTDNVTGLQWQDNNITTNQMDWNMAQNYCANGLSLHNNPSRPWRLPSIDELKSIIDYSRYVGDSQGSIGAIDPIFENINSSDYGYWSSTTRATNASEAWAAYFKGGVHIDYWDVKYHANSVRCVR